MPIIIEADLKCDDEGCTETARMHLIRDPTTGNLIYGNLPPGWGKLRVGGREEVFCPPHYASIQM